MKSKKTDPSFGLGEFAQLFVVINGSVQTLQKHTEIYKNDKQPKGSNKKHGSVNLRMVYAGLFLRCFHSDILQLIKRFEAS